MNVVILASHGELALGMKQTASMIIGENQNIYAISAYRDEDRPVGESIREVINHFYETKAIFILTDVLGGSVNTEMIQLVKDYPKLNLITGMNLPLVLTLATQYEQTSDERLAEIVEESKQGLLDCKKLIQTEFSMEVDDL